MCQGEIKFHSLCVKTQRMLASHNLIPASESVNPVLFSVNWNAQAHLITVYFNAKVDGDESLVCFR